MNNKTIRTMNYLSCGTKHCRGKVAIHHVPLKRSFCDECWKKHCEGKA